MSANVLESYLISIGFAVHKNELRDFELALKKADDLAVHHTSGIIGQFVKWQSAIIGGFAAVGIATAGLVDKIAEQDLGFKLTAQRMFLTTDAARSLTIATNALGHSLGEIAWNPELHRRFIEMMELQDRLKGGLGPDFEHTMERIRDVRAEFSKMGIILQYIGMEVAEKLYKALGGDSFLEKLKGWTQWLEQHSKQISDWITHVLVPILKDALHVLKDLWKVTEALAHAFVRLIGAISGDDQLKNGALTFDSLGKAIDKAADYMTAFVDAVTSAELAVIDLLNALVRLSQWDFKGAAGDAQKAGSDLTLGGTAVLGTGLLGLLLGAKTIGGLRAALLGIARSGAGGLIEGAGAEAAVAGGAGVLGTLGAGAGVIGAAGFAGSKSNADAQEWVYQNIGRHVRAWGDAHSSFLRWLNNLDPVDEHGRSISGGAHPNGSQDAISAAASRYGVAPALAHAVAKQESGIRQFDSKGNLIRSGAGALGMFQLMPSTAGHLGVNPADTSQNIDGGVRLLSQLIRKYRDVSEALAAYNFGEGNLDKSIRRHGGFALDYLPAETRNYVRTIEGSLGSGAQVAIHAPITINNPRATAEQIRGAVKDGVSDALDRKTRNDRLNVKGTYS
jgi:hypothetical protein